MQAPPVPGGEESPLERLRAELGGTSVGDRSLVGRVLGAYALAQSAVTTWKSTRKYVLDRCTYTVAVRSDDPIYPDVHDWLLSTMTPETRRSLVARSSYTAEGGADPDDPAMLLSAATPIRSRLHLAYNDARPQRFALDGHRVHVSVTRWEESGGGRGRGGALRPDEILFSCQSEIAQRAVLTHLERLVASHKPDRRPMLWLLNPWGSWSRRADLPQRDLSTVVLEPGQADRLLADLQQFLAAEPDYVRLGLPWHRGYLLHGPPGTGKTSAVRALATRLGLDLWYAPLSDLEKDASLMSLVAEVRPRSMLLLEDIDAFDAATDRATEQRQVTTSGLLNALDGVSTPHGLITVMTTNHPEVLDPAVVRTGRVDVVEEFTLPDDDRVNRMFEAIHGRAPLLPLRAAGRSSADVMETLKQHLGDPAAAEAELTTGPVSLVGA